MRSSCAILSVMRYLFLLISIVLCGTLLASTKIDCKKYENALTKFRVENRIGGMALYVRSPNAQCYVFSGSLKKWSDLPITENNLWQIGSITKSYFSAILLQLEAESESGKLPIKFNIGQKLKQWLPQYPDWAEVSIQQLLNMTGGIYSYTELPGFTKMILSAPNKIWSPEEIVRLA